MNYLTKRLSLLWLTIIVGMAIACQPTKTKTVPEKKGTEKKVVAESPDQSDDTQFRKLTISKWRH